MPKYMMLYRGPQPDPAMMTPENGKKVMDLWLAYFGKMGKAIIDGGNPLSAGASVMSTGKDGKATDVNGYSIVEAKDMKAAKAMTKGHPHLMDAKNSIDIFEITPVPGM